MQKIAAVIFELIVLICSVWVIFFLSTLWHEFGHAVGYMIATKDRNWKIRVGWGKKILNSKRLKVNLLVFDGLFTPSEMKIGSKGKLIITLLGGPVFSLIPVVGLLILRLDGLSFQTGFLADSAIEFFLNLVLLVNLFILILSVVPIRYFFGEIKGLESDGLQIIHALKRKVSSKDIRWNRFIEDVCFRDISTLSDIQKNAVLCFWYDSEMNSGGHSGYFDCYPETDPQDLEKALLVVGNRDMADNFRKAVEEGENDGWQETDDRYYSFVPSLCDLLEDYVERNKDEIIN